MHVLPEVQILQIIFIFKGITPTSADTKSKVYSNVGPLYCASICLRTVECFGFKYSKEFLSCHLPETFRQDEVEPHFINVPLRKDKDDDVSMMKTLCPVRSRKLFSKRNSMKCIIELPLPDEDSSLKSPKLLLFSQSGKAFQLDKFKRKPLRDFKVNSDMPRTFRSVQYLPASQMLLVVTENKMMFVSKRNIVHMVRKCIVTGIADEAVFYVDGNDGLSKMNQYAKNITFIKDLSFTPQAMAVDRKNKIILISNLVATFKYAYNGEQKGTLLFTVQTMHFDLITNVFGVQDKTDNNIYFFDSKEKRLSRTFFQFSNIVNSICAHNDRLYLVDRKGVFYVMSLRERTYKPFRQIRWYACCVIP